MSKQTTHRRDKRKTMVSIVAIILAVLMAGSVLFGALSTVVNAASSSELKKELNALQSEADGIAQESAALESDIAENESETQSVVDQKTAIDKQMELTRLQIENLEEQIYQYNLLISAKQEELDQAYLNAEEMGERYKERLRAMEEAGDVSYWSVLFDANSIMDFLTRLDDMEDVAQADQAMVEQLNAAAKAVEDAKAEIELEKVALEEAVAEQALLEEQLEAQRATADALIAQLISQKDELEIALGEYAELEEGVRAQIAEAQAAYEKALADEEAARKILEAQQAAANNQKPPATSSGSSSGSSSGGFGQPLGGGYYTIQSYGYREHPIYGYYSMHYGVDLAAGAGVPILAVQSGTVTLATYASVNGNYVTINHNNGFSSLYAHMTNYIVSVGQNVSKGQVIGYVGSTGWSTGPHLHLELFYGGGNVNPAEYISLY